MAKTIRKMPSRPVLVQKKKVAAYARVSSGKNAMLHSLSAQIAHYSAIIQNNDQWQYIGVYADEAVTGTKAERDDFQRLLSDCRAGKIDMIITKSISRFARNTVTLLEIVRELKLLGIDVYFEEQNIHTISSDGELMITILASYAQEESLSASENQKWRIKRDFKQGKACDGTIYGYRLVSGRYEVIPNEAEVIRNIYTLYLSGLGYLSIAKKLNNDGVPSRFGGKWNQSVISAMLSNYTYTGNLILQKTFRENHLTKVTCVNEGQLPKYQVEDSHEAIVSAEIFKAVQEEKVQRQSHYLKKKTTRKSYPFSRILVCNNCGKNYRRKTTKTGIVWICSTYNTMGKSACSSKQIPEATLDEIALNIGDFTQIKVCDNNTLIFQLSDGSEKEIHWADRSRSQSWTDEMKQAAREKAYERRNANCQE